MVNEALKKVFGWPVGYLLNEGFEVKCAGTEGVDGDGTPIVSDRHLICTLDDHLPGAQAHAVGNVEFTDDMWVMAQPIDWSNPVCQCGKGIAP